VDDFELPVRVAEGFQNRGNPLQAQLDRFMFVTQRVEVLD